MLIYLDNCSFNRPFDNQKQERIHQETLAKLQIQEGILHGTYLLAWSYMLDYENIANPFPERKMTIAKWKRRAKVDTSETKFILERAREFQNNKIRVKDALLLACAIALRSDYFITTDDQLIKKCLNFEKINVLNPVTFVVQTK